jgi:arabinogalactan endo-1,4-beta-galactosidase
MNLHNKTILVCTALLVFVAHQSNSQDTIPAFAKGADIGWLSEMEASGYIFKNDSGAEEDCMDILKEHGINSLRFRVWVNPAKGYCGKNDVVTMAKRAKDKGFRIMIDFHYSDWWADPGKQNIPAAWTNDNLEQMCQHVYSHTYEILDTLKKTGITPEWVQVGNENDNGMLWPMGKASSNMKNFAQLVLNGYNAVKAIDSTIKVLVHVSNGYKNSTFRWIFDGLKNNGAKWDIVGMSLYPYWANMSWSEANTLCLANMKDMITRYGTQVMICETGMDKNQAEACKAFLTDLQVKTYSVGGLGVFYWEPEAYNWEGYNLIAWDYVTKAPTIGMDAFLIDPANPPKLTYNVTFKVSMKGSGMSTSNGVYILGTQTGWTFTQMTNEEDSMYTVSLKLVEGDTAKYYFITTNSWDNYKNYREPAIPNECGDSIIVGWIGDRLLIVPKKDTTVAYNWGTCEKPLKTEINQGSQNNSQVEVYPNPSSGIILMTYNKPITSDTYIEFFNISGKLVKKLKVILNSSSTSIDISEFAKGIYILKLTNNGNLIEHKKIIVS